MHNLRYIVGQKRATPEELRARRTEVQQKAAARYRRLAVSHPLCSLAPPQACSYPLLLLMLNLACTCWKFNLHVSAAHCDHCCTGTGAAATAPPAALVMYACSRCAYRCCPATACSFMCCRTAAQCCLWCFIRASTAGSSAAVPAAPPAAAPTAASVPAAAAAAAAAAAPPAPAAAEGPVSGDSVGAGRCSTAAASAVCAGSCGSFEIGSGCGRWQTGRGKVGLWEHKALCARVPSPTAGWPCSNPACCHPAQLSSAPAPSAHLTQFP